MKIPVRNNYGSSFPSIPRSSQPLVYSSEVMIKQFFDFYDYYIDVCTDNSSKDGQQMMVNARLNIRFILFSLSS